MIQPDEILEPEWVEWYSLDPRERFARSVEMWQIYLSYGGTLHTDADTQSPFFDSEEWRSLAPDGRASVHIVRRC